MPKILPVPMRVEYGAERHLLHRAVTENVFQNRSVSSHGLVDDVCTEVVVRRIKAFFVFRGIVIELILLDEMRNYSRKSQQGISRVRHHRALLCCQLEPPMLRLQE